MWLKGYLIRLSVKVLELRSGRVGKGVQGCALLFRKNDTFMIHYIPGILHNTISLDVFQASGKIQYVSLQSRLLINLICSIVFQSSYIIQYFIVFLATCQIQYILLYSKSLSQYNLSHCNPDFCSI